MFYESGTRKNRLHGRKLAMRDKGSKANTWVSGPGLSSPLTARTRVRIPDGAFCDERSEERTRQPGIRITRDERSESRSRVRIPDGALF